MRITRPVYGLEGVHRLVGRHVPQVLFARAACGIDVQIRLLYSSIHCLSTYFYQGNNTRTIALHVAPTHPVDIRARQHLFTCDTCIKTLRAVVGCVFVAHVFWVPSYFDESTCLAAVPHAFGSRRGSCFVSARDDW